MLFQTSAWRAAMPISTCSPPPPIRISGRRAGFGSQSASFTRKCRPSKVAFSSVHIRFRISTISSSARSRSRVLGNAQPVCSNSGWNQPAPSPAITRPGRDVVDRRDLLGEDRRVAEEGRRHERAELGALGDRGDRGEQRPRLEDREVRAAARRRRDRRPRASRSRARRSRARSRTSPAQLRLICGSVTPKRSGRAMAILRIAAPV